MLTVSLTVKYPFFTTSLTFPANVEKPNLFFLFLKYLQIISKSPNHNKLLRKIPSSAKDQNASHGVVESPSIAESKVVL